MAGDGRIRFCRPKVSVHTRIGAIQMVVVAVVAHMYSEGVMRVARLIIGQESRDEGKGPVAISLAGPLRRSPFSACRDNDGASAVITKT
jgi:hypothetical protein